MGSGIKKVELNGRVTCESSFIELKDGSRDVLSIKGYVVGDNPCIDIGLGASSNGYKARDEYKKLKKGVKFKNDSFI